MKFVAVLLAILACTLLVRADPLAYPTSLSSSNGVLSVTLTVNQAVVSIPNYVSFNSRLYYYNGSPQWPGPTLRVRPGDLLNITLINLLGANSASDSSKVMNSLHKPNSTNLHTHGLHVDPAIDSVFRVAQPGGGTLNYLLRIPADHAPGFHWYHAHSHGSSALQVMGGLLGALVVEPAVASPLPSWLTSMQETVLVMHHLKFDNTTDTSTGGVTQNCGQQLANFSPFKVYSFMEFEAEFGTASSNFTASPTFGSSAGVKREWFIINGQINPTLTVVAGSSTWLRFVNSIGGYTPTLYVSNQAASRVVSTTCSITIIAKDGVFLQSPRAATSINSLPGQRFDLVLQCSTPGTYYLSNDQPFVGNAFLTIVVTGSAAVTPSALPSQISVPRPSYLTDLTSSSIKPNNTFHIHLSQGGRSTATCPSEFWMGQGSNCNVIDAGQNPSASVATCPFSSYMGERGLNPANYGQNAVATLDTVQEWVIHGLGNDPHPIHVHVNHFQIISYTSNSGGQALASYLQVGDWMDTVPALDGQLTIRFVPTNYTGEVVIHCHQLIHEDRGLMNSFLVQSTYYPSTANTTTPTTVAPTIAPAKTGAAASLMSNSFVAVIALASSLFVMF